MFESLNNHANCKLNLGGSQSPSELNSLDLVRRSSVLSTKSNFLIIDTFFLKKAFNISKNNDYVHTKCIHDLYIIQHGSLTHILSGHFIP